jgi:hypothetical protein
MLIVATSSTSAYTIEGNGDRLLTMVGAVVRELTKIYVS